VSNDFGFGIGTYVADVASITPTIPPSSFKEPVRCSTTGPINLATEGLSSPDGIPTPLLDGEHVLVQFQAAAAENGIYDAHAGAWTRRADFNSPTDNIPGSLVSIQEGTLYGNQVFVCTTDAPVVIGTTPITFTSIGSVAGSVTSVGLSAPAEFSVANSPVISAGTLALSWASAAQNRVLATPNGASGVPSLRALVAADIPSLDAAKITSGTLPVVRGGTGVAGTAAANTIFAGPVSGAPGAVSFRAAVINDLPSAIPYSKLDLANSIALTDIETGARDTTPAGDTLVQRDAGGDFEVNGPTLAGHPASKAYVDAIYDIGGGSNGVVAASAYILNFKATRALTLPTNFAGSVAEAVTAATASTVFTILKNGVSIGTMTFAASGTIPTFSVAGTTSLAIGNTLRIQGPASPDTTLSDLTVTLLAAMA
jgi:hypothetical protein